MKYPIRVEIHARFERSAFRYLDGLLGKLLVQATRVLFVRSSFLEGRFVSSKADSLWSVATCPGWQTYHVLSTLERLRNNLNPEICFQKAKNDIKLPQNRMRNFFCLVLWALRPLIVGSLGQPNTLTDTSTSNQASILSSHLHKRGDDTTVGGKKRCPVEPYDKKPDYPKAQEVKRAEESTVTPPNMVLFLQKAIYWKVPSDYPPDDSVEVPLINHVPTDQLDAPETPLKLAVGGIQQQGTDVDHVYEAKLLDMYFYERLESRQITCGDIQAVFDEQQDATNPDLGTRLNFLFSNLASYQNPDFVGMWGNWNQRKSRIWDTNLTRRSGAPFSIPKDFDPETVKRGLTDFAMILSILNDPTIHNLFQMTNARIYTALGAIDALINARSAAGHPYLDTDTGRPVAADWAPSYRQWLDKKIVTQNVKLQETATSAVNAIPTQMGGRVPSDPKWRASVGVWSAYMAGFTGRYPVAGMTLPAVGSWPVLVGEGMVATGTAIVAKPTITKPP